MNEEAQDNQNPWSKKTNNKPHMKFFGKKE